MKSWFIGKDPDAGKDWRQEEKGTTEDKMVGWHHWLDGHEFEQALGDGDRQESLVCCSPWGPKELDMTEGLSNNKKSELVLVLFSLGNFVVLPFKTYIKFLLKSIVHFGGKFWLLGVNFKRVAWVILYIYRGKLGNYFTGTRLLCTGALPNGIKDSEVQLTPASA